MSYRSLLDVGRLVQTGTSPLECWYGQLLYYRGGTLNQGVPYQQANTLYAALFPFTRGGTVDRIGVHVTTAGNAGDNVRVGIYAEDDSSHYPGVLVVDSGELDVSSTGVKSATVSVQIQPNLRYWTAIIHEAQNADYAGETVQGLRSSLGVESTDYTDVWRHLAVAQVYGALPDPFPGGAALSELGATYPNICLRFSA